MLKIFTSFLLIFIFFFKVSYADTDLLKNNHSFLTEKLLEKLFPGSKVKTYPTLFGISQKERVVISIRLRGIFGFIPINTSKMIIFTDNLGALAFEIYLFDKKNDLDSLIVSAPNKNKNFE